MLYATLAMLAMSAPALAEPMRLAQAYERGTLPPEEILDILRSGGFDPLGQPLRRGPNYVLRAVDDTDREVRVVINARSGDILSVTPVATASRLPPSGSMGPYERMAPGYLPPGPPGVYRGGPPVVYEDDGPPPGYGRPPAPVPNVRSGSVRPPNPNAARLDPDEEDASPPLNSRPLRSGEIPPPAGGQDGLLPPPPERFPQRAAPPAPPKPKPAQRAAAAPPKTAPLPKPRPNNADAPAPSSPPVRSTPIPPPAPEQPPAPEETPH
jgi:hypothetical protein